MTTTKRLKELYGSYNYYREKIALNGLCFSLYTQKLCKVNISFFQASTLFKHDNLNIFISMFTHTRKKPGDIS